MARSAPVPCVPITTDASGGADADTVAKFTAHVIHVVSVAP